MNLHITNFPATITKDINTISLSWDNILENEQPGLIYLLFIKEDKWKALYRGRNTRYLVKELAPSTVYEFKLKLFQDETEIGEVDFKAATDFHPYGVMHMTRAVAQSKIPMLRKIINQRPVLLETPNKEGKTPLVYAVDKNDLPMVTFLITLGASVNNPLLGNLRTPLMVALFKGHIQLASLLIDRGANVNQTDCNGLTALHYSVDSGIFESVQFAVEHRCEINVRDNKGWTPLLRAVILEVDDKIVKYLVRKGADTDVRDKNGFGFREHCKMTRKYRWCKLNLDIIKASTIQNERA